MKIALIDGSPKVKNSNSGYFLELLKLRITANAEFTELRECKLKDEARQNAINEIAACDVMVFAFPLYVDSVPGNLLKFMCELETAFKAMPVNGKTVYAMSNCGFFEGHQNYLALEVMRNWVVSCGLKWGGGIGIGCGEMLGHSKSMPLTMGPGRNMAKALKTLVAGIMAGTSAPDIFVNPAVPRFLFIFMVNKFWKFGARKNGLKGRDLYMR